MPITLSKNQLNILYKALLDAIAYRNDAFDEKDLVALRDYHIMSEKIFHEIWQEKEPTDEEKYW